MSGVCKVEISESAEALKQLLRGQKSASDQERVQLLYLLKSEQAKSVQAYQTTMRSAATANYFGG